MKNNFMLSFVITALVTVAAVLSSLAVFGALSWDEVGDNFAKLAAVAGIALVASYLIMFINNDKK